MPRIAPGDRIVLLSMPHDPDPVPIGTEGTVEDVNDVGHGAFTRVEVSWDDGRSLMLSMPPDEVRVVRPAAEGWARSGAREARTRTSAGGQGVVAPGQRRGGGVRHPREA